MAIWHHIEAGAGEPLVLLHGIGMSHAAWLPVLPFLAPHRRVLAFDVAGFGHTPPLEPQRAPSMHNLAAALGTCLHEMGVPTPIAIAGNSMGGQIALEAARLGIARSVVAISPSGLWRRHPPTFARLSFFSQRWFATQWPRTSQRLLRSRILRTMLLSTSICPGARGITSADALRIRQDLVAATAFARTFANTEVFRDGRQLTLPITVAFGTRDRVIGPASRRRDALPAHTRWLQPAGWGHVPMWQDPAGVAGLILRGSA